MKNRNVRWERFPIILGELNTEWNDRKNSNKSGKRNQVILPTKKYIILDFFRELAISTHCKYGKGVTLQ